MATNSELEQGIETLSEELENSRRIAGDNVQLWNEEHDRAERAEAKVRELNEAIAVLSKLLDPVLGLMDDLGSRASALDKALTAADQAQYDKEPA